MDEKYAYILMTAMPPTYGHLNLIRFACGLDVTGVHVIVCTQPDEPLGEERALAVHEAFNDPIGDFVTVHWFEEESPQIPKGEDDWAFWAYWRNVLTYRYEMQAGDYIVSSEDYGIRLAEETNGVFMPYDLAREIDNVKATNIRESLRMEFNNILPEFQHNLIQTVTMFGAESVGKTHMSRACARTLNGWCLPEWARPYLEAVGSEVTEEKMHRIWHGQAALQLSGSLLRDKPFVVQDTDLFSTIGYWNMYSGKTPNRLIEQALDLQSDLYVVLSSDIPFHPDPLRYGGDKRETQDQYWIDLCERYDLNYVYVEGKRDRLYAAEDHMLTLFSMESAALMDYTREK